MLQKVLHFIVLYIAHSNTLINLIFPFGAEAPPSNPELSLRKLQSSLWQSIQLIIMSYSPKLLRRKTNADLQQRSDCRGCKQPRSDSPQIGAFK